MRSKNSRETRRTLQVPGLGERELRISTYGERGRIWTSASVVEKHPDGSVTFIIGGTSSGDFMRRVAQKDFVRATAKAVEQQHAEVLARLPQIEADALAFYAAQPRTMAEA